MTVNQKTDDLQGEEWDNKSSPVLSVMTMQRGGGLEGVRKSDNPGEKEEAEMIRKWVKLYEVRGEM